MSKRLVITGVATVIAYIILWLWLRHDDTPVDALQQGVPYTPGAAMNREADSTPVAQARKDADSDQSLAHASRLQHPDPSPIGTETAPKGKQHLDDYLSARNRDARSLLQAFRASKNKDYLTEALERYPDDPMVLLHRVLYDTEPTDERKAILQKLLKLLPDDAVPRYLLGEQLLQEGDTMAALELLMDGSLKPYANNYANEIVSDAQEFLVASGIPPGDALGQASFNVELRLLEPMRQLISMVQAIHTDISANGNGDQSATTWAITGASLAQSMHSQMSQTLIENLWSVAMEEKFLSLLPPETELVAGGTTVAQRTKEIEEFRAIVKSFELMCDAGFGLPEAEKLAFFKRLQEEGEFSALLWLNGQGQKEKDKILYK